MNTEQNYVGRGHYANTPPQAAQNAAKTSPTADSRPLKIPADFATVNESLWSGLNTLLDKVDDFLSVGNASDKIEVINNLTLYWLTVAPVDLVKDKGNRHQLEVALRLVAFLSELEAASANVHYFLDTEEVYPKEVSNG